MPAGGEQQERENTNRVQSDCLGIMRMIRAAPPPPTPPLPRHPGWFSGVQPVLPQVLNLGNRSCSAAQLGLLFPSLGGLGSFSDLRQETF